jgi:hypothetical protein
MMELLFTRGPGELLPAVHAGNRFVGIGHPTTPKNGFGSVGHRVTGERALDSCLEP